MNFVNYKIQYYLIHGIDNQRKQRMEDEFKKSNLKDVKWMIYPNKNELNQSLIDKIVNKNESFSCGIYRPPNTTLPKGLISCTYKHYLCLKDIVENNHEYGVIMEDNIYFSENIQDRVKLYINQLNEHYTDWDIIFDSSWLDFRESEIIEGKYVYPKKIGILEGQGHGGTR